jgi:hypothetical protein
VFFCCQVILTDPSGEDADYREMSGEMFGAERALIRILVSYMRNK